MSLSITRLSFTGARKNNNSYIFFIHDCLNTMRLKTALYVDMLVRQMNNHGYAAYIVHKGFESAGALYVQINLPAGKARLYNRHHDYQTDSLTWAAPISDFEESLEISDVNTYTKRLIDRDPDCWVVEIDDFQDRLGTPKTSDLWPE